MREVLFVLVAIAILLALTAFRYRTQILSVYRVWKVFKQARSSHVKGRESIGATNETNVPLVNCAKCGTWIPESSAIKLRARMYYCSATCVERRATAA